MLNEIATVLYPKSLKIIHESVKHEKPSAVFIDIAALCDFQCEELKEAGKKKF
jgi:hypothetical protein